MKRLFWILLALFAVFDARAQFAIVDPTVRPTANTPDTIMPPGQIYIDLESIPHSRFGRSTIALSHPYGSSPNYTAPEIPGANTGAFRINCTLSHMAFDDPIVHPGRAGSSHLHQFFGNTTTRSASDLANMATAGNSTCHGGTINRSGYWVPPVVYHCPNNLGGCNMARNGEVQIPLIGNFYYKCASEYDCDGVPGGATNTDGIHWPLPGHRMIIGSATNRLANFGGLLPSVSRIECSVPGAAGSFDHIPSPAEALAADNGNDKLAGQPCTELNFLISFNQCWNGIDLDTPNHSSHMATEDFYLGCNNPLFPIRFPEIAFNIHLPIAQADLPYLRLSSDLPETTGLTQSGSTTTAIKLAASESATDSYYVSGTLSIGSEVRYITAYNGTTKVATITSAFSGGAPAAGVTYGLRNGAGYTLHADWVNGWSADPDVFGTGVGSITDVILRNCYRKGSNPKSHGDCHDDHLGNPADPDDLTPANMWGLN